MSTLGDPRVRLEIEIEREIRSKIWETEIWFQVRCLPGKKSADLVQNNQKTREKEDIGKVAKYICIFKIIWKEEIN